MTDYFRGLYKRGRDHIESNIEKCGWVEPVLIKETPASEIDETAEIHKNIVLRHLEGKKNA